MEAGNNFKTSLVIVYPEARKYYDEKLAHFKTSLVIVYRYHLLKLELR